MLYVKYGLKSNEELHNIFDYYKNLTSNQENDVFAKLIVSICYILQIGLDKEKKAFKVC